MWHESLTEEISTPSFASDGTFTLDQETIKILRQWVERWENPPDVDRWSSDEDSQSDEEAQTDMTVQKKSKATKARKNRA